MQTIVRSALLGSALVAVLGATAHAAGSLGIQTVSDQHDAIVAEIAKLDAAHLQQRADCNKRFLVNDCLIRVDADYRARHLELQQQLDALDLAQRQQRAKRQLESNVERQQQSQQIDPQRERQELQRRAQKQDELRQRQREQSLQKPDAQTPAARAQDYRQRQQRAASDAAAHQAAPPLPLPPGR